MKYVWRNNEAAWILIFEADWRNNEADVNFRTGLKIHSKRNISSSNSSDIASALATNTETQKK